MKPLRELLMQLKPRQKIMLRHHDGVLYNVFVNNTLSGNGAWGTYEIFSIPENKWHGPYTGGYFLADEHDVLRVSGRFV